MVLGFQLGWVNTWGKRGAGEWGRGRVLKADWLMQVSHPGGLQDLDVLGAQGLVVLANDDVVVGPGRRQSSRGSAYWRLSELQCMLGSLLFNTLCVKDIKQVNLKVPLAGFCFD